MKAKQQFLIRLTKFNVPKEFVRHLAYVVEHVLSATDDMCDFRDLRARGATCGALCCGPDLGRAEAAGCEQGPGSADHADQNQDGDTAMRSVSIAPRMSSTLPHWHTLRKAKLE